VLRLIRSSTDTSGSVLVDVSAGIGFYTIALAPYFRHVLHCDLSVAGLTHASGLSQKLGTSNINFLRTDYLALPFRSLTHVLCLDSLIRGDRHDLHVLGQIADSLRSWGCAVVDFHNWWHNPLRRLGLLPENFHNNRSYSRREAEALLHAAGPGS
jgi:SAM-dependent methyltransferase